MSDPVLIACPSCSTLNRVPAGRLGERPVCGRCRSPLFTGRPVELSQGSFPAHVEKASLLVLVDFWAPWCGPCRMMAPVLEQAATALEPQVRVAKVNTEAEPGLASRYRIQAVPTLILFRGGSEVARQSGALPLPALLDWIRRNLGS